MADIKGYLKDLLTKFPSYTLSEDEKSLLEIDQKTQWITQKLFLKKFRKTKVYENRRQDILQRVKNSLKENKPFYFLILFGGYKHFWNSSHPEIDFAELFNLNFMSQYLAPILAVHKPGVILDYASEDVILNLMNNYPKSAMDAYAKSFNQLIKIYAKSLPKNFKINYVRTGEQYNSQELIDKVKKLLPQKRKEWDKLSSAEQEKRLHRSYRSVMWDGDEDLTKLDEGRRLKRMIMSKIIEDTFYEVEDGYMAQYYNGDNHISLILSWGLYDENSSHWLTLGSTFASSVDFWIGRGILEVRGEKIIPRVVSHNQYDLIKKHLKEVKIDKVPLKNLESIEIYEGELKFN